MDSLASTLRALLSLDRDEHPSSAQLLDYVTDELAEQESERLREHVAACPGCAAQLLELGAFPDVEPPPVRRLSEEDVERSLARFRAEIRNRGLSLASPRAGAPAGLLRWLARAAALAIVLLGGLSVGRALRSGPPGPQVQLNPVIAELAPSADRATRSDGGVSIRVPAGADGIVLVLGLADGRELEAYSAEIRRARGGAPLWSGQGLGRRPEGSFVIVLPRGLLPDGELAIELSGRSGDRSLLLATYRLSLRYD